MPERVTADDVVPRPMPGSGASIRTNLRDAIGILGGKGVADHVADVVGDKVGLVDLQRVEHAGNILALRLLVVAACRAARRGPCRAGPARSPCDRAASFAASGAHMSPVSP